MPAILGIIGLVLMAAGFLGVILSMMEFSDVFDSIGETAVLSMLVGVFLTIPYVVIHGDDSRIAFMSECLKDKKQYECTALWCAGESHDVPIVMPMPIYTGR